MFHAVLDVGLLLYLPPVARSSWALQSGSLSRDDNWRVQTSSDRHRPRSPRKQTCDLGKVPHSPSPPVLELAHSDWPGTILRTRFFESRQQGQGSTIPLTSPLPATQTRTREEGGHQKRSACLRPGKRCGQASGVAGTSVASSLSRFFFLVCFLASKESSDRAWRVLRVLERELPRGRVPLSKT